MSETDRCIFDILGRSDPVACIGKSAAKCIDDTEGGSTPEMVMCFMRELSIWDARLNRVYQRLMTMENAQDAKARDGVRHEAVALRDAQRAWIKSRDAKCDYEVISEEWGGGTGARPALQECLMVMTGQQAMLLDRMRQERELEYGKTE